MPLLSSYALVFATLSLVHSYSVCLLLRLSCAQKLICISECLDGLELFSSIYILVACAIIAFVFGHVSHGITAMVPSHSTSFLMPIIALSLCPSSPISFPYVDVVLIPLAGLSDVACPHLHSHNTQCTRFYAFTCSLYLSTCLLPLTTISFAYDSS